MQQLIDQIKNEAGSAPESALLSHLYDKYAGALYGRILQVVKQKDIAENILEKVFIKAFNEPRANVNLTPFTHLINQSRDKSYRTVKALKVLNSLCSGAAPAHSAGC